MISRRKFLQGTGSMLTFAGTGLSIGFSPSGMAAPAANNNALVMLFFRGGMDALNFLVPLTGTNRVEYESKRPNIQIPGNLTLNLDGDFGLPATCSGLHSLYQSGDMAMIHAVGMPEGLSSRSHFDSQAMYERGTPGDVTTSLGWLTRHLQSSASLPNDAVIPSMAPGNPPESLNGLATVMSIDNEDTSSFHPNSGRYQEEHLATLEQMYSGSTPLDAAMRGAIDNVNILTSLNLTIPDFYPDEELAQDLGLIAQIIKADLGMQVATVDFGGWDTHQNSGNFGTGFYVDRLGTVSAAVAAFFTDLANAGKKDSVVLATQTDFGRRVRENGNRGTDHGTAQAMMVAGGNINGGKIYGTFPGIDDVDLYLNADLAVSTDFRRPLSDIVFNHLGNSEISTVFPGYTGDHNMELIQDKVAPPGDMIFSGGFE
jgi:uncharacterized protein (DUF1501 family)